MMTEEVEVLKNLLAEVPFFSALDERDREEMAESWTPLALKPGDVLYEAGQATDGLYVIRRGKMVLEDPSGETLPHVLARGDLVGEEALLNRALRAGRAVAQSPVDMVFLPNSLVQYWLLPREDVRDTIKVILESRELVNRNPMPWLQPTEQVHLMTRKHPVFLALHAIPPLLLFLVAIVVLPLLELFSPLMRLISLLGLFVVFGLWLAWSFHNWANDFYLITDKRMVWVERISGLYDSRQEAPLGTLISVGLKTSRLGAIFGFSDVIVRTYIGDIRFERVEHARVIGRLIESFWTREKALDLDLDAKEMRAYLRKKFGKPGEESETQAIALEAKSLEEGQLTPARQTSFFEWLFSDFLKVRYEVGGVTTYRKHWFVLLKKSLWPLLSLFGAAAAAIAVVTYNLTVLDYTMALVLSVFTLIGALLWLWYVYTDWRNDTFQLTANQVIDIDRKPLGKESKRSAPLENILSIEYERNGFLPMLFNFGTVYITIGNTQLSFNDVYQPSIVQQDIFTRMGSHQEEKEQRHTEQERERVAEWFKVYHDELHSTDPTRVLNPPVD